MVTGHLTIKKVLINLLKDFLGTHSVTSLANELSLSRVGMWKVLKKLESNKLITISTIGKGKTSASLIKLNWENQLLEKSLSLYLTEEAIKQRRWQVNFKELEDITSFVILYGSILSSPQQANDIDIVGITQKNNFLKLQNIIDKVQKTLSKKIHSINFVESEFKRELQKQNRAFIDATKKGIVLFGQDNFVKFIKGITK